ncbi:MAG: hypothetical protein Q9162_000610 [Coniocarpon cinnabarinum]
MHAKLATTAALASAVSAQVHQGFNYGAAFTNGNPKQVQDFQDEFTAAQNLPGHKGFTSARLYTNIQAKTTNTPISAFQAAINTKTTLLLGIWGSSGQATVDTEISALNAAIDQYGSALTDLIAGVSVGSEDLYRNSPTGIEYKAGIGANPGDITGFINCVRGNLTQKGVNAPIGHVDTWTAWVNDSNSAVVQSSDFLGVDMYPYFQTNDSNGIDNGANLFYQALSATQQHSQGKPVWVTETGWPVSGDKSGQAETSVANAKIYWDQVACKILGQINTWWFTLQDAEPDTPNPSFGIIAGPSIKNPPLFDLSCSASNTTLPSNVTTNGQGSSTGSSSSSSTGTSGSGAPGSAPGSSSPSAPGSSAPGSAPGSSAPGSYGSGAPGSSVPGAAGSSGSAGSPGSAPGAAGSAGSSGSAPGNSAPGSYGSGAPGSASGSAPGSAPGSSVPGAAGSAGSAPGSSAPGASGASGSAPGSSAPGASGSTPGSYGSGAAGSAPGSSNGASGAAGSVPGSSSGASPYGASPAGSSSPSYGSSPYGSTPTPGAGSGTNSGRPASYTGAAVANSPQVAMVAGVMGLAALFA